MHFKYAKVLAIVVHENMKLANNTMNNERLFLVNTKFLTNKKKIKKIKNRERQQQQQQQQQISG